ncbi:hypothetical protein V6N13_103725 [Hibiscus sabdariffa]
MAALSTVANLVGSGQEIVEGDDIYGGSDCLLSRVTPKSGVLVKRVNTSDLDEVAADRQLLAPRQSLCGWRFLPTLDCKLLIFIEYQKLLMLMGLLCW